MRFILKAFLINIILISCNNHKSKTEQKRDANETTWEALKNQELPKTKPIADIDELEMEINNGGFKQYFINSSSQNSYETLKLLEKTGKLKTATLMKMAFSLINPKNLDEKEFLERLRKRKVDELYDNVISEKLSQLDEEFYKYPDGSLK